MSVAYDFSPREQARNDRFLAAAKARMDAIRARDLPPCAASNTDIIDIAGFTRTQSRIGEEQRFAPTEGAVRAVLSDPAFWAAAAHLPDNDIHSPRLWKGAPLHYPSWCLFAVTTLAGIQEIGSIRGAIEWLSGPRNWQMFAETADQFAPEGWTRVGTLPQRGKRARYRRHAERNGIDIARAPYLPAADPPLMHHVDYYLTRWRAQPVTDALGRTTPHPWHGVRTAVHQQFRIDAMNRAQALGYLDPTAQFDWNNPRRTQAIGFDGTKFTFRNAPGATASMARWLVGGRGPEITASNIVFASVRGDDWRTRIILDFAHSGTHPASEGTGEAATIEILHNRLKTQANGGYQIMLVDSIVRGRQVTRLERGGTAVVCYPHALRSGGTRTLHTDRANTWTRRANPNRRERSHLRKTHTHIDRNGAPCSHLIFVTAGVMVHVVENSDGTLSPIPVTVTRYRRKRNTDGTIRAFYDIEIPCHNDESGVTRVSVPLFHTDATSTDPAANWGEYVRTWGPHTAQFGYLYGRRNDTESWHNTVKRTMRYMLHDASGQLARCLGAAIAENAMAWALDLRARGMRNPFDDTYQPT
jgi:hypothetical protein